MGCPIVTHFGFVGRHAQECYTADDHKAGRHHQDRQDGAGLIAVDGPEHGK